MNRLANIKMRLTSQSHRNSSETQNQRQLGKQIFRQKNYVYCVAEPKHREEILKLILKKRRDMPLITAYCKKRPTYDYYPAQKAYYEYKIDKSIATGLSVICIDTNTQEIICVVCAIYTSDGSPADVPKSIEKDQYFQAVNAMVRNMENRFPENIKKLLKVDKLVVEAIAGSSKIQNKKIFSMCSIIAYQNGLAQGVKYAFSHCVNHYTRLMVQKLHMTIIAEIDAKEFVFNGDKPFQLLDDKDRSPCFAIKKMTE